MLFEKFIFQTRLSTKGLGALPQTPLKVLFREITSAQAPRQTLRILKKLFQKDVFMGFRSTVLGGERFGLQSDDGV